MTSQPARATELVFTAIGGGRQGRIAVLSLSRPDAANSFNAAVISECVAHLKTVAGTKDVRALVLRGKGKHFSAGADLAWMKASAALSYQDNLKDSGHLTELFESLAQVNVPTIAAVHGSAFGGAVGLTACCDIAIATMGARFALSEVKLGLAPAVIMPYLARKMRPGALRRYALTGKIFSADEALAAGLVERVVPEADLDAAVRDELNAILAGSLEAQAATKALLARVIREGHQQAPHTAETIARLRTSPSGQAGLKSFFDKQPAPWAATLPADFAWHGETPK